MNLKHTLILHTTKRLAIDDGFEIGSQTTSSQNTGIKAMQPRYSNISFKHILLPICLSSYKYGEKTYRFLVNGQTGEVQGERPYSYWKIAGAVLLAFAVGMVAIVLTKK